MTTPTNTKQHNLITFTRSYHVNQPLLSQHFFIILLYFSCSVTSLLLCTNSITLQYLYHNIKILLSWVLFYHTTISLSVCNIPINTILYHHSNTYLLHQHILINITQYYQYTYILSLCYTLIALIRYQHHNITLLPCITFIALLYLYYLTINLSYQHKPIILINFYRL